MSKEAKEGPRKWRGIKEENIFFFVFWALTERVVGIGTVRVFMGALNQLVKRFGCKINIIVPYNLFLYFPYE